MITFIDWLQRQDEGNSEARRKREIARGAQPEQPPATMLGGSLTWPGGKEALRKVKAKLKKRKHKKKG